MQKEKRERTTMRKDDKPLHGMSDAVTGEQERGLDTLPAETAEGHPGVRFKSDAYTRGLVRKAAYYHSQMRSLRKRWSRANDYFMGRQLDDKVVWNGLSIRVRDLLKLRGLPEFQNDILSDKVLTMKGILRQESMSATCRSTDSNEDMYAALFSELLRCNDNLNERMEQNAEQFEKFCIYAFIAGKVNWMMQEGREDVVIQQPDIYNLAVPPFEKSDLSDVSFIAEAHDMEWADILETFGPGDEGDSLEKSERELKDIFARQTEYLQGYGETGTDRHAMDGDFLHPLTLGKYRVIEIWNKERNRALWCHDYASGECYFVPMAERSCIEAENARRLSDNVMRDEAGMPLLDGSGAPRQYVPPGEVKLIQVKEKIEQFWYFRLLSPEGHVLREGVSPYTVKRDGYAYRFHPYVFLSYPSGGEPRSFIERGIDKQRATNHYMLMFDSIMANAAKGSIAIDKESVTEDQDIDEMVRNYSKPNGVVLYSSRKGDPPKALQNVTVPAGLQWMIEINRDMAVQQTGVQGALQGVHRNTSGKQYEMERNAASTTVADYFGAFYNFQLRISKKQLWLIQEYYDSTRSVKITGDDFKQYYNPETMGDINADLALDMDAYSAVQRAANNDMLWQLMLSDKLDVLSMLDCGSWSNTARLKKRIKEYMEEKAQAAGGQPMDGGQPMASHVLQPGNPAAGGQAAPLQPTVGTTATSV